MQVNPALARLPSLIAAPYKSRIAGEIKNFDPLQFVDKQEVRRYDDFILYALAASEMAMTDAKLTISPEISEPRRRNNRLWPSAALPHWKKK